MCDNDVQEHEMQIASDRDTESEGEETTVGRNAALSLPLAALGFVTRLASGIFSRGQRIEDPKCDNSLEFPAERTENSDDSDESSFQISSVKGNSDARDRKEEHFNAEAQDKLDTTVVLTSTTIETSNAHACSADDDYSFKRFDTAKDPIDHYFIGSGGQVWTSFLLLTELW